MARPPGSLSKKQKWLHCVFLCLGFFGRIKAMVFSAYGRDARNYRCSAASSAYVIHLPVLVSLSALLQHRQQQRSAGSLYL